jgi:hypothetical protein
MKAKLLRQRHVSLSDGHANRIAPFTRGNYPQLARVALDRGESPHVLRQHAQQIRAGCPPYVGCRRVRYCEDALAQVSRLDQFPFMKVALAVQSPPVGASHGAGNTTPVHPQHRRSTFVDSQILPFVPLDRSFLALGKEVGRNANHHCSSRSDQQALSHVGSVSERTT